MPAHIWHLPAEEEPNTPLISFHEKALLELGVFEFLQLFIDQDFLCILLLELHMPHVFSDFFTHLQQVVVVGEPLPVVHIVFKFEFEKPGILSQLYAEWVNSNMPLYPQIRCNSLRHNACNQIFK